MLQNMVVRFFREDTGAEFVEYVLLVGLAISLLGVLYYFRNQIGATFQRWGAAVAGSW